MQSIGEGSNVPLAQPTRRRMELVCIARRDAVLVSFALWLGHIVHKAQPWCASSFGGAATAESADFAERRYARAHRGSLPDAFADARTPCSVPSFSRSRLVSRSSPNASRCLRP